MINPPPTYIINPDELNINLKENENFEMIVLINEEGEKKYDYCFNLTNKNSSAKIIFIVLSKNSSSFSFNIKVHHKENDTKLKLKFKSAIFNNSKISFNGNIKIGKNLKNITSDMKHHNIMLSKDARALSTPNLEIESNDVEVSHGFATSEFDPNVLYYCQSRGYNKKSAIKKLTKSFLLKDLKSITNKDLFKTINKDIQCSIPK